MGSEKSNMVNHPELEELLAFASTEEDVGLPEIQAHLATCAECAGTVRRYRLIAVTLREDDAIVPPPAAVARAKALLSAQPSGAAAPARDVLAPLRRIIAELIFDSAGGLAPGLAGFRGSGDRHLTYVAESVQVDLRLQPPLEPDGFWRVQGQLDAEERLPLATVDMVRPGRDDAVARATTDLHGVFSLEAPAGRYDILVRLPGVIRVLPGLDLR